MQRIIAKEKEIYMMRIMRIEQNYGHLHIKERREKSTRKVLFDMDSVAQC
jgi:hypothetical protein